MNYDCSMIGVAVAGTTVRVFFERGTGHLAESLSLDADTAADFSELLKVAVHTVTERELANEEMKGMTDER